MNPLVSVILPCYNHAHFVQETLLSVFNQDYSNIEVLIRDDFSTDDSVEKIKEFFNVFENSRNIPYKIDFGTENIGITKSINRLMALTQGEIVISVATDDVLKPERISYIVERSLRYKEIDLFACDAEVIDSAGKVVRESFYQFDRTSFGNEVEIIDDQDIIFSNKNYRFASGINFGGFGIAIRKRILEKYSYQLPENLGYEDYFLSFLGIVQGGVMFTTKKLVQYRRTGNNLSSSQKTELGEIIDEEAKFLRWTNTVEIEKINYLRTGTVSRAISNRRRSMILFLKQNLLMNNIVISLARGENRFLLLLELFWLTLIGPKRKVCLVFLKNNFSRNTLVGHILRKNQERKKWAF